jgi:hypothetical protein
MRVMVLVKASKDSEAGKMPDEKLLTAMMAYNEELAKAGVMKGGEGLHPSSKGVRVKFSGDARSVRNGPFTDSNDLVAGFWLWEVDSMEDAVAWLKRCPNPHPEDTEVEIRPLFEAEDFGDEMTPELQAQEAKLRSTVAR